MSHGTAVNQICRTYVFVSKVFAFKGKKDEKAVEGIKIAYDYRNKGYHINFINILNNIDKYMKKGGFPILIFLNAR